MAMSKHSTWNQPIIVYFRGIHHSQIRIVKGANSNYAVTKNMVGKQ